jgi:hypothetical protein
MLVIWGEEKNLSEVVPGSLFLGSGLEAGPDGLAVGERRLEDKPTNRVCHKKKW